jgi:hypothetical protein
MVPLGLVKILLIFYSYEVDLAIASAVPAIGKVPLGFVGAGMVLFYIFERDSRLEQLPEYAQADVQMPGTDVLKRLIQIPQTGIELLPDFLAYLIMPGTDSGSNIGYYILGFHVVVLLQRRHSFTHDVFPSSFPAAVHSSHGAGSDVMQQHRSAIGSANQQILTGNVRHHGIRVSYLGMGTKSSSAICLRTYVHQVGMGLFGYHHPGSGYDPVPHPKIALLSHNAEIIRLQVTQV